MSMRRSFNADVPLFGIAKSGCGKRQIAGGPPGHAVEVKRKLRRAQPATHGLLLGQDCADLRHDGRLVRP